MIITFMVIQKYFYYFSFDAITFKILKQIKAICDIDNLN